MAPIPSLPYELSPQHKTTPSSCGERRAWCQQRTRGWGWGESCLHAEAQVRQRVRCSGCVVRLPNSAGSSLELPSNLTRSAHVCVLPALMATAFPPVPRPTAGRFVPISADQKQEPGVSTHVVRARARSAVVGLAGQGPLALSPRLPKSPSPSCPWSFSPQHLTVASSCVTRALCQP